MKCIRIKDAKGVESIVVGRLIDETTIVDRKDTILDEKICAEGGSFELPVAVPSVYGKEIKKIYYPAFKQDQIGRFIILTDLAVCANRIMKICEEYPTGVIKPGTLELAVKAYHYAAINMLSGKGGIISSGVVSSRTKGSGRAVLLINGDFSPKFVGLPDRILNHLGISDGEPVIVGRDPSIWHGSMEILRARPSHNDCIEMHPIMFAQMGADCDGDQVYVYKIPETPECVVESIEHVGSFAKKHAVWPGWMSPDFKQGEPVNWDIVQEETAVRAKVTGFSVTPREILEKSPRVVNLCACLGKAGAEDECKKIAEGIEKKDVLDYLKTQNDTQLNMKVWLGPIGAASNKLKVLAGENDILLASAMYISERLQQMLLSAKHVVSKDKKDAYSVKDTLDLLNRRGKFERADLKTAMQELVVMGLDHDKALPIVAYLWVGYPAMKAAFSFLEKHPQQAALKTRRSAILKHIEKICIGGSPVVKDRIRSILGILEMCKIQVTIDEFRQEFLKNALGLGKICSEDFPVFDLCSNNGEEDRRAILAKRILIEGHNDPSGITKVAMDIANQTQAV